MKRKAVKLKFKMINMRMFTNTVTNILNSKIPNQILSRLKEGLQMISAKERTQRY